MLDRYHAETVKLGELDIEIYVEAHEEDMEIEGNACCCGECEPDCDTVARQYAEKHYPWGWCSIRVSAEVEGTEGEDWLGGCAYESAQNFIDSRGKSVAPDGTVTYSGYYDDMRDAAIEQLTSNLRSYSQLAVRAGIN